MWSDWTVSDEAICYSLCPAVEMSRSAVTPAARTAWTAGVMCTLEANGRIRRPIVGAEKDDSSGDDARMRTLTEREVY